MKFPKWDVSYKEVGCVGLLFLIVIGIAVVEFAPLLLAILSLIKYLVRG